MVKFLGLYDAWSSFLDFSRPVARFGPPKVGGGGKSGNFLGVGRNPQEMPIEAEGGEDININSTRHWLEASVDFSHLFVHFSILMHFNAFLIHSHIKIENVQTNVAN